MANITPIISSMLTASWPTGGFWEVIIKVFNNVIVDYALTIIVFTIILKLILFPLDYLQKSVTKKNSFMQKKLQPQMAELQKKYGNDKQTYNQKVMELYKKENYSMGGSCLGMILSLVLTLVIFMTLWTALGNISATRINYQYQEIRNSYETTYEITEGTEEVKIAAADAAAEVEYDKETDSFLWIKNIWQPDTNANPIQSYDSFKSTMSRYKVTYLAEGEDEEAFAAQYNTIMESLPNNNNTWNGYFILVVLAAVITFLNQFVMNKMNNSGKTTTANPAKNMEADPTATTNKLMSFLLPGIMIWFTWKSSSVFALYIIMNSLVGLGTSLIINKIMDNKEKKKLEIEAASNISYSRKNK